MTSRRTLLKLLGAGLISWPLSRYFLSSKKEINGRLTMPNVALGHRLRHSSLPEPSETIQVQTLIIGAGIAGLSACRALSRSGQSDFLLLELEDKLGGNSMFSKNAHSSYPLGAHYLPIPNLNNHALLDFLEEINILKSYDAAGLPVYDEFSLCHAPQEKLFIHGRWQDGLVPSYGIAPEDSLQINLFLNHIKQLKSTKGNDGRYAFEIPIADSSKDTIYTALRDITFDVWLQKMGFDSAYLLWYLNYCCRDDYGAGIELVSAWAGLHYHAARRGTASNTAPDSVLTWPNGNGFLMKKLAAYAKNRYKTQQLAFDISPNDTAVAIKVFDAKTQKSVLYICKKLILATPQFVTQRLLKKSNNSAYYDYFPWLVANVTLSNNSFNFAWDNVNYQGKGLGYIYAQHQNIGSKPKQQVITYYRPLDIANTASESRAITATLDYDTLKAMVLEDLRATHLHIEDSISQLDVHLWGHCMICPTPTYFEHPPSLAVHPRIRLAHSDLSGVSIFEEAFYWGTKAAESPELDIRQDILHNS